MVKFLSLHVNNNNNSSVVDSLLKPSVSHKQKDELHRLRMQAMQKRRANMPTPCKGRGDGLICQSTAKVGGRCFTCHQLVENQRQQKHWQQFTLSPATSIDDVCTECGYSLNGAIYIPGTGMITGCSLTCHLSTQWLLPSLVYLKVHALYMFINFIFLKLIYQNELLI